MERKSLDTRGNWSFKIMVNELELKIHQSVYENINGNILIE